MKVETWFDKARMLPGDLVRIRFWDEYPPKPLVGIVVCVKRPKHHESFQNTNFYKVWVAGVLSEFAIEELELISRCQKKKLK